MGRFDTIKQTIDANIKQNGNQGITGQIMNSVLNDVVSVTDSQLTELESKVSNIFVQHGADAINDLLKTIYIESANGESLEDITFSLKYVSYNSYQSEKLGVQIFAEKNGQSVMVLNTIAFPVWIPNERIEISADVSLDGHDYALNITIITADKVVDSYPNTGVSATILHTASKDTSTFPKVLRNIENLTQRLGAEETERKSFDADAKLYTDSLAKEILGKREAFKLSNQRYYDVYLSENTFDVGDELEINITNNTSTGNLIIYGFVNEEFVSLGVTQQPLFKGIINVILSENYEFIRVFTSNGIIEGTFIWTRKDDNSILSAIDVLESETIPRTLVEGDNVLPNVGDEGYLITSDGTFGAIGSVPKGWILIKWAVVLNAKYLTFGVDGEKGDSDIYNYAFYDYEKKLVGSVVGQNMGLLETISVPNNAVYFCATYKNNFGTSRHQINKGEDILPYSEYVEPYWFSGADKNGVSWYFRTGKDLSDIEIFTPRKIYSVCNDITEDEEVAGERNYTIGLYVDHLIKLNHYEKIRFDSTQRDVLPIFSHFDSYTSGKGWTWNEDNSNLKLTEKSVVLSGDKTYPTFNFTHCSVRNTATSDKFPKILCIGDSVTEGYLAGKNKENSNYPNAYWQWIKMFFEFDKKQNGSGYDSLLLGKRNVVAQKGEYIDGSVISFRACAEGKGGAKLSEYLRSNEVNGVANHFYDSSIAEENKFSILYWLEQYRTMDDNGVRLTGGAGQNVVGSDGKTYKIGLQVTDVNAWDVCTPTHVIIQLGYNDGDREGYIEDMAAMADIIQNQVPNCIVGFSLPDCPGTYFPEFYPQYGNDLNERYPNSYYLNPAKSSHETFMSMNKKLMTLDDAENKRYYIPSYFISPTADSAPCRKQNFASWLSGKSESHDFNVQGYAAPNLHPNNRAHAAWGYEMYSWIKYTLLDL